MKTTIDKAAAKFLKMAITETAREWKGVPNMLGAKAKGGRVSIGYFSAQIDGLPDGAYMFSPEAAKILAGKNPVITTCDLGLDAAYLSDDSGARASLDCLTPDDIPELNDAAGSVLVTVSFDRDVFLSRFTVAAAAASKEESRKVLMSVFVKIENGEMIFAGTDGRRLHELTYNCSGPGELPEGRIYNPRVAVALKAFNGTIKMDIHDRDTIFSGGGFSFRARHIEGTYPSYRQVIPTGGKAYSLPSNWRSIFAAAAKIKSDCSLCLDGVNATIDGGSGAPIKNEGGRQIGREPGKLVFSAPFVVPGLPLVYFNPQFMADFGLFEGEPELWIIDGFSPARLEFPNGRAAVMPCRF